MVTDNKVWQFRASMALDTAIASKTLITYLELADAAQIPSPHRINKLTRWLEALIEVDHQSARPLRSAWVISKNRGEIPAPGFFMKCHSLGFYSGSYQGKQAAEFHQEMLQKHFSYPANTTT